jgi:adenosylcobinamide kinase/adenosylcobinamide-phosphate guanylyltransferase
MGIGGMSLNSSSFSSRQIILVTGAARSGKSEWAETLAGAKQAPVIYLATARESDTDREWQTRIAQHRRRRPRQWQTLEVPLALSEAISMAQPRHCLLVDSLGTWVANLLGQKDREWEATVAQLLDSVEQTTADIIFVAEEVGWGVVPAYEVGRQFRDRLGHLSRQIGGIANTTYLITGGHALNLSQLGQKL